MLKFKFKVFGYMLDLIANMCVCVKHVVIIIKLFKKKIRSRTDFFQSSKK